MKLFRKSFSLLVLLTAIFLLPVLLPYNAYLSFHMSPSNTIFYKAEGILWSASLLLSVWVNVFPSLTWKKTSTRRNKILEDGVFLLRLFFITVIIGVLFFPICYYVYFHTDVFPELSYEIRLNRSAIRSLLLFILALLVWILIETVLFWNGIIRIYATSVQLGIKWRIIGIVCGFIPIAHLFALHKIIRIAADEAEYEEEKYILNETRAQNQDCHTRYPILLVHGVFFRDFRFFNYWGRIPAQLKKNGAALYYGNQQSAASVEECGKELAGRIKEIIKETGCGKVNIIAHSKGGLDARHAISKDDAFPYVASLTTINTPHKGCIFADYLLEKIPQKTCDSVAKKYNAALKKLGDSDPDFLTAVRDLTASSCAARNEQLSDCPGIYYQSVASKMNRAASGRFPLNLSYPLVKYFDGANDGLVALESAKWGSNFISLSVPDGRGISHGDMIDLNRENISGFDVREFYVNLVKDLKAKGL